MQESDKDRVGKTLRINLGTKVRRKAAREALEDLLSAKGWQWQYKPLRKVKGVMRSPTRGGGSHQVEPVEGHIIAALLYDDVKAWESAQVIGLNLLERADEQDNGHRQLWLSSLHVVPMFEGAAFKKALAAAVRTYHHAGNSDFFAGRKLAGIRPEIRTAGVSHGFAWWMEQALKRGWVTQAQLKGTRNPQELRKAADAHMDNVCSGKTKGLGDGVSWGWTAEPGQWKPRPIGNRWGWPLYSSDNNWGIGGHVVAFQFFWIWFSEIFRMECFRPGGPKKLWAQRTQDLYKWFVSLAVDDKLRTTMKAGKHTFKPSIFDGTHGHQDWRATVMGPFSTWPKHLREATREGRGENQYHSFCRFRYAPGAASKNLNAARLWAQTCKEVHAEGRIDPQILWTAIDLAKRRKKGRKAE